MSLLDNLADGLFQDVDFGKAIQLGCERQRLKDQNTLYTWGIFRGALGHPDGEALIMIDRALTDAEISDIRDRWNKADKRPIHDPSDGEVIRRRWVEDQ